MSQLLYFVPFLLLISSVLGSSMASAPVTPVTIFTAPQMTVTVPAQAVVVGETQTLQIHLDQSAERVATVALVVTYPNGTTDRSLHSVQGKTGTLSWSVRPDAGTGVASFSLTVDGCGCEQKGTVPPPTKLESDVAGTFQIIGGSYQ